MNEFPEDVKVQGETAEARGLRWKTEEDDLQRLLLENDVSTEASDVLIDQLARKHRTEEENNDVFPTMEDFDRYEREMSFGTSERGEGISAAQNEPPAAIEAVATVVESVEEEQPRQLSQEMKEALVRELNTTKDEIDRAWSVIRVYGGEKKDGIIPEKRTYTEEEFLNARREYDQLRTKAKELALEVAGGEQLFGAVKIPDLVVMDSYNEKVSARTRDERKMKERALPKEERDAYYDALARKRAFVQALTDNGVRKDMALGLYGEFADKAIALDQFSQVLESQLKKGDAPTLTGGREYHLLKWHGIKEGSSWNEIAAQVHGLLDAYHAVPPHVEHVREDALPSVPLKDTKEAAVVPVVEPLTEIQSMPSEGRSEQFPTAAGAVDEVVPQEVIDGWKEQGIMIKPGTTAAELGTILRNVGGARGMESIAATEARAEAAMTLPAEEESSSEQTPPAAIDTHREEGVRPEGEVKPTQTPDVTKEAAAPAPSATEDLSAQKEASGEQGSLMPLTWEDVDAQMADADPDVARRARAEWERRTNAALQYSKEKGTFGALRETLRTIRDGFGNTVPEKWLKEFHEVPDVARYLREHPIADRESAVPEASVTAPALSNKQLEDMAEAGQWENKKDTTAETEFEMREGGKKNRENVFLEKAISAFHVTPSMDFAMIKAAIDAGNKPTSEVIGDLLARGLVTLTPPGTYTWVETALVPETIAIPETEELSAPVIPAISTISQPEAAIESLPVVEQSIPQPAPLHEAPVTLSSYDAALEEQWNARDKKFQAPDWELVPMEKAETEESPLLTAEEEKELNEVGTLWASFLEREYGLDIEGKEIAPVTEEAVIANGEALETLALASGIPEEALGRVQSTEAVGETVPGDVTYQFERKFGVSGAMLESIASFSGLSAGQQLLVLKNLEQLTLTDITKEAKAKQQAEWGNTKWWKRGLQMIASLGMKPEYRTAELEKELLAKTQESKAQPDTPEAVHRKAKTLSYIESLAKVAQEGPEVTVENGELRTNYVSFKDLAPEKESDAGSEEQKNAIENFNRTASAYAKIPHDWTYRDWDTPGMIGRAVKDSADALGLTKRRPNEFEQFEKIKLAYDVARASLLYSYKDRFKEGGEDPVHAEMHALQEMNKLDERVTLDQLFNSNPDAEAALENIADMSAITRAAKEFWKSKGMFILYGGLTRAAAVSAAGVLAVPTMGASIYATLALGGVGYGAALGAGYGVGRGIGQKEGKKLMKEKREDGRMGEEDEREEFEYSIPLRDEKGAVVKDQFGETVVETKKRKIKAFTDATFFTNRIDSLTAKLEKSPTPEARTLIEKKIAQTVALMSAKLSHGMINFAGSSLPGNDARKGETIGNRLSFMQAMTKGAIETNVDEAKLEQEAERLVGLRETTITELQKNEIKHIAAKAAKTRAAFALAGAGLSHAVSFGVGVYRNGMPDISKNIAELDHAIAQRISGGAPESVEEITEIPTPKEMASAPNVEVSAHGAPELDLRDPASYAVYMKEMNSVFERQVSAAEVRALWQTDAPSSPMSSDYYESIQGKTHNAIVGAMLDKNAPLTEEEIAAVYRHFGYNETMGRQFPEDMGLDKNEAIIGAVKPPLPLPPLPSEMPSPLPLPPNPAIAEVPGTEEWARLRRPMPEDAALSTPRAFGGQPENASPRMPLNEMVPHVPTDAEMAQSVAQIETSIHRYLTSSEVATFKSLKTLEMTTADDETRDLVIDAEDLLAEEMKKGPLSPSQLYHLLEKYSLQETITVVRDAELERELFQRGR